MLFFLAKTRIPSRFSIVDTEAFCQPFNSYKEMQKGKNHILPSPPPVAYAPLLPSDFRTFYAPSAHLEFRKPKRSMLKTSTEHLDFSLYFITFAT